MGVSVIVIALSCIAALAIADTVPVVMWGPLSKSSPVLNENAQENFIETVLTSPFTLAFVEDKLASEDLSLCKSGSVGSCFPYLSSVQPKAYYAQISQPAATLGDLTEEVFYAYVDKDGNLDNEIPVEGISVAIVTLQEDPELDREANLVKHDGYIKKIYSDIASKLDSKKVLALYTGKSSTSLVRKVRQAPQTTASTAAPATTASSTAAASSSTAKPTTTTSSPATGTETSFTFASPEFLVHLSSIFFTDTNQGKSSLDISGMSISNKTATSFDVSLNTNAETLKFTVVDSDGYWNVQDVEYGKYTAFATINTVGAADGFSYYCGPAIIYTIKDGPTLTLIGLQIEPNFTNSTTTTKADMSRFNDPYNCVGFTSIPIWTGLFITVMMLFILSVGITWMMDINTMDRFDDPKGKTIIISATD